METRGLRVVRLGVKVLASVMHKWCMGVVNHQVSGLEHQIERVSQNLALCLATAVEQAGEPAMFHHLQRVESIAAELEYLLICAKEVAMESVGTGAKEKVLIPAVIKKAS